MTSQCSRSASTAALSILLSLGACSANFAAALPVAHVRPLYVSGADLMKQGDDLARAGKYNDAADAYQKAADAFDAAGQMSKEADALNKCAAMNEKEAGELTGGNADTAVTTPPAPSTPHPARHTQRRHPAAPHAQALPTRPATPVRLARLSPRSGHIVGLAATVDGRPIPTFTVLYSGFENGKLATTFADGSLADTVNSSAKGHGGRYAIRVPPGAYRVSAYVTYHYHGKDYNFEMEQENPPAHHDYDGLGLDKLRGGLVRNFRLYMTGRKKDADESYEEGYYDAYYGGRISIDASYVSYNIGQRVPPNLVAQYPADSKIVFTLTPDGPLVDGSPGRTLAMSTRLGDDGKWFACLRNIPVGVYSASAQLVTPDGQTVPLRLATEYGKTIGVAPNSQFVMDWHSSVTIDFPPNDLGPNPCMGVKPLRLFVGE